MDEVRIGFIGCGGNARGHMNRLLDIDAARLVAVCDVDEARAGEAATRTGAEGYGNFREMLERDDLDAAYLSVPVHAHGEIELAVVERGLPFFVEKPVARHLDIALAIEEAATEAELLTCVGYQLRYCGSVNLARDTLDGEIISLAAGKYWSGSGRSDTTGWVTQLEKSGGQLLEQATHTIDMMRYLVGEVVEVSARHANQQLSQIDCPDVHCVTLEFENGALGTVTTTWAYDTLDWSHTNVLDILYGSCLMTWNSEGIVIRERREGIEDGAIKADMVEEEFSAPGAGIDEVFVDAVSTGDAAAIRSPYGDGVKSLAVCLAALKAGESRKSVRL